MSYTYIGIRIIFYILILFFIIYIGIYLSYFLHIYQNSNSLFSLLYNFLSNKYFNYIFSIKTFSIFLAMIVFNYLIFFFLLLLASARYLPDRIIYIFISISFGVYSMISISTILSISNNFLVRSFIFLIDTILYFILLSFTAEFFILILKNLNNKINIADIINLIKNINKATFIFSLLISFILLFIISAMVLSTNLPQNINNITDVIYNTMNSFILTILSSIVAILAFKEFFCI